MWWKAGVIGLVWVYLHICSPIVSFDELFTNSGNDSGDHWWLRYRRWLLFLFMVIQNYLCIHLFIYICDVQSRFLLMFCSGFVVAPPCSRTFPLCRGNRPLLLWWLQSGNQQGEGKWDRRESRDQMEKYCEQKCAASATSHIPHMHKWLKTHISRPIKRQETFIKKMWTLCFELLCIKRH